MRSFSEQNNYNLYISKVSYQLKQREINDLYKKDSKCYDKYFSGFNEEKYVRLMSLKRKAFLYEYEMRFFLVSAQDAIMPKTDLLEVPIELSSFIRFTLCPLEPEKDIQKRKEQKLCYSELKNRIRKSLKQFNPNFKLYSSALYNDAKKVAIVE